MNQVFLSGYVGKVERKGEGVFVRLCHKDGFFNKKKNEWAKVEDWFTIFYFGKKAEAAEREIKVGDKLITQCGLVTFPKTGPTARMRLNGISFYVLLPTEMKESPGPNGEIDDGGEYEG